MILDRMQIVLIVKSQKNNEEKKYYRELVSAIFSTNFTLQNTLLLPPCVRDSI
jgi:hypothetical protein